MRNAILGCVLLLLLGANGGGCNNGVVGVQTYGSITGRVLDATSNRPIPNAIVSVGSLYVGTAGIDGAFVLNGVPVGNQTVTARSPGFSTASTDLEVTKGQTAQAGYLRLVPFSKPNSVLTLPPPATPTPSPPPATVAPPSTPTPAPTATTPLVTPATYATPTP